MKLNELAIQTFDKLLALNDEEFFKYFDQIQISDLSEIIAHTNLILDIGDTLHES